MNHITSFISNLNWYIIVILCLTLGLAPFSPPHIYEKLYMLFTGALKRPVDWFDLFLHGTPWLVLIIKIIITLRNRTV